jgi:hypothetical protein
VEDSDDSCHSARWYLHIEAVFVFEGRLDHWSAASGQGRAADPRDSQSKMQKRNSNMKTMTRFLVASRRSRARFVALAIAGLLGVVVSASDANAFSCGRSVVGAGCIGPRGAVGVNRHGAVAVGRYGNVYAYHRGSVCYWRNGQRICPWVNAIAIAPVMTRWRLAPQAVEKRRREMKSKTPMALRGNSDIPAQHDAGLAREEGDRRINDAASPRPDFNRQDFNRQDFGRPRVAPQRQFMRSRAQDFRSDFRPAPRMGGGFHGHFGGLRRLWTFTNNARLI